MTDTDIPDFLLVDEAEAASRKAWNVAHPLTAEAQTWSHQIGQEPVSEKLSRVEAAAPHRAESKKMPSEKVARPLPPPGSDRVLAAILNRGAMTKANHARIMGELPTDKHRQIFVKLYGPGQGASLGAGAPTPVRATKDARRIKVTPAGGASDESRSATKGAGRVRVPSGSRGTSSPVSASSTNKPPRATAAGDWKSGLILMLARPEGVTLTEIGAAYGWQEKSASARLSGIRKERTINTAVEERGRVYRTEKKAA